ncbi:50S ribosomal protein L9 [Candidatus Peregrinibacteria bacterium CG10_big_fil_rev_8_21_14_0_10_36_19]|nr:MAG: 50S ribosomal protein L9 [Candidatus Peregrinibacteria bacterium CG10_big_fil_rev_8_21_14_0_10_36_19]
MQVVLNEDVKKLGYRGEVVDVKRGYFRNFLFPRGLADFASESRLRVAESRKESLMSKKQQILENAKEVLAKLADLQVRITGKVTEDGKLYGSVTEDDVLKAVKSELGIELDKSQLKMSHFKEVGEHTVKVHLGEGFDGQFTVLVAAA